MPQAFHGKASGGGRGVNPVHGWVILDKPLGLGSTQAVGAIKRGLRDAGLMASGRGSKANRIKVGHGGTLDPLATGVLPIALGEATKLTGRMLDASKTYDFTIEFGTQTDTLDLEGKVIATSETRPSLAEIQAALPRFTGPIQQAPPAYSAIKIDGQRAYDLARAGEDVAMKTREVMVYALQVSSPSSGGEDSAARSQHELAELGEGEGLSPSVAPSPAMTRQQAAKSSHPLPLERERTNSITLTAHVSKGTYIRSLARDIALALKTVGHVTMLRRTRAGPFGLENAISLDNWADAAKARALDTLILPFEAGLDDIPALSLSSGDAGAIRQGRVLAGILAEDGLYCAKDGDVPVALIELTHGNLRVVRGFNFTTDPMSKERIA